ncbi:MAG: methyltransferase [Muribaculaceae bacterium]|nr:methyltransferase [Muribaculaceae bacterium]
MDQRPFRFKRFSCFHHRSALKIGVDAVLLACWTEASSADTALDVGTGCGVIALILAQRFPNIHICGIDLHAPSVDESLINFENSPWSDRLTSQLSDFSKVDGKYDLIISNPPFFKSGVSDPDSERLIARHQGELSPHSLIKFGATHLNPKGKIAMIFPADQRRSVIDTAEEYEFRINRECYVRGHLQAPYKRLLIELIKADSQSGTLTTQTSYLTLETTPGTPTEEYRELCRDFYIKF